MSNIGELLRSKLFWLRVVELILSLFVIGLVADHSPVSTDVNRQALVYGTVVGFIMISIITLLGHILDNPLNKTIMLIINLIAGLLFLISGGFIIDYWTNNNPPSDKPLGSGILALVNGIVYIIDFLLVFFKFV